MPVFVVALNAERTQVWDWLKRQFVPLGDGAPSATTIHGALSAANAQAEVCRWKGYDCVVVPVPTKAADLFAGETSGPYRQP